jgi:hypothetical protein
MELAIAQALAGQIVELVPVCPLCKREGAVRIDRHSGSGETVEMPCHLVWSAAHGVCAAVNNSEDMPEYESVPHPGGGYTSAWKVHSVRCTTKGCEYSSAPSAFCMPVGPIYRGP